MVVTSTYAASFVTTTKTASLVSGPASPRSSRLVGASPSSRAGPRVGPAVVRAARVAERLGARGALRRVDAVLRGVRAVVLAGRRLPDLLVDVVQPHAVGARPVEVGRLVTGLVGVPRREGDL